MKKRLLTTQLDKTQRREERFGDNVFTANELCNFKDKRFTCWTKTDHEAEGRGVNMNQIIFSYDAIICEKAADWYARVADFLYYFFILEAELRGGQEGWLKPPGNINELMECLSVGVSIPGVKQQFYFIIINDKHLFLWLCLDQWPFHFLSQHPPPEKFWKLRHCPQKYQ